MRLFQVAVVREGAFSGAGGPAEIVAAIFDPAVRRALGALAANDNLHFVEVRNGRMFMRLRGWPADATTLLFILQTAHAIASNAAGGFNAFLASGRALDTEPTLVAYRAGLRRSERIGKLLLFAMFGVIIPGAMPAAWLW
jgi:hypothetical protein